LRDVTARSCAAATLRTHALAGKDVFITGTTGFVGKCVLEKVRRKRARVRLTCMSHPEAAPVDGHSGRKTRLTHTRLRTDPVQPPRRQHRLHPDPAEEGRDAAGAGKQGDCDIAYLCPAPRRDG
jgi:nucleoside-diphosphate-sugar epimerase